MEIEGQNVFNFANVSHYIFFFTHLGPLCGNNGLNVRKINGLAKNNDSLLLPI